MNTEAITEITVTLTRASELTGYSAKSIAKCARDPKVTTLYFVRVDGMARPRINLKQVLAWASGKREQCGKTATLEIDVGG